MPLPVIGGVTRCAVSGTVAGGQRWVNVLHFRYADGASAAGPTEIANLHQHLQRLYSGTAYSGGSAWANQCSTQTSFTDVTYLNLDGTSQSIVLPIGAAGLTPNANMPPECAPVLTLRTAKRGRRHRGRIYLPAPTTNAINSANGQLNSAIPTGIVAQWNGMVAALDALQWEPVVASYGQSWLKVPNTKPPQYVLSTWTPFATPITVATMDVHVDVQRARKR